MKETGPPANPTPCLKTSPIQDLRLGSRLSVASQGLSVTTSQTLRPLALRALPWMISRFMFRLVVECAEIDTGHFHSAPSFCPGTKGSPSQL